MQPDSAPPLLVATLMAADAVGIKLEMMDGLAIWEALPTIRHQSIVDRIRATIKRDNTTGSDCGCYHFSDIAIRFKDGSFKRPDVAIYCKSPEEVDEATIQVPEAVVEVVSKGYEAKDLELGPPFYLRHGVADVLVFDPATQKVIHSTASARQELRAPCSITLSCKCTCEIPAVNS